MAELIFEKLEKPNPEHRLAAELALLRLQRVESLVESIRLHLSDTVKSEGRAIRDEEEGITYEPLLTAGFEIERLETAVKALAKAVRA